MFGRRALGGVMTMAMVALAAGSAGAQPQDEKAVAEVLFLEGQRLLAAGQIEAACAKFEESERHDQAIGTLLNLGNCFEKAGRTASAWATFKEVADMAVAAHDATREQYAKQRAASLTPRLSKLTIVVPAEVNTDGLVIRRDGVQVGAALWGVAVPVDPGQHKIDVAAPGRRTWSTVANVEPDGSQSTVPIPALDRDPTATPAQPAVPPPAQPAPAQEPTVTIDGGSIRQRRRQPAHRGLFGGRPGHRRAGRGERHGARGEVEERRRGEQPLRERSL